MKRTRRLTSAKIGLYVLSQNTVQDSTGDSNKTVQCTVHQQYTHSTPAVHRQYTRSTPTVQSRNTHATTRLQFSLGPEDACPAESALIVSPQRCLPQFFSSSRKSARAVIAADPRSPPAGQQPPPRSDGCTPHLRA
eukprot:scaffold2957_cov226-Isochrysis_galbana.AAC.9